LEFSVQIRREKGIYPGYFRAALVEAVLPGKRVPDERGADPERQKTTRNPHIGMFSAGGDPWLVVPRIAAKQGKTAIRAGRESQDWYLPGIREPARIKFPFCFRSTW
jgi:hypothetical protein